MSSPSTTPTLASLMVGSIAVPSNRCDATLGVGVSKTRDTLRAYAFLADDLCAPLGLPVVGTKRL